MRITNKVMQNNSLRNINNNKVLQDTLNTQLSTGKKVDRPSDDPVVAIRSLRLRSDVSQIDQYYKKNIKDAESWLELTESSAKQTVNAITKMINECETGASDQYTVEDKLVMVDNLKELKNEVYRTGDADYAGRYIFTGYRTNTSLSFANDAKDRLYSITEAFSVDDMEEMRYIDTGDVTDITRANYASMTAVDETTVNPVSYYRFRLAYDDLDKTQTGSLTLDSLKADPPVSIGMTVLPAGMTAEDAYKTAAADGATGVCYLVPDTGEVVMSADVFNKINDTKKPDGTHDTFTVSYDKTSWQTTDLRPEHYFYCTSTDGVDENGDPKVIEYNKEYRDTGVWDQPIEYQIGFNQSIQVNSYAADIYSTSIGRDVDELTDLAEKLTDIISQTNMLQDMSEDTVLYNETERELIGKQLDAAKKAKTYLTDELQKTFSRYITRMQGYLDSTNEAVTQMGNRGAQIELVANRLSDQQTTFKELQSDNEDADATEVAVQLSSAQVSYEAALMATSKMIQTTLLNYL